MINKEKILEPWYAINDDPKEYNPWTARESGADGEAHNKAHHRKWELSREEHNKRVEAQFNGIDWLIAITKATRRALHESKPYSENNSREWYKRQKVRGLCDVFYFYDEWAKEPLQPGDKRGIICWYVNRKTCYFTFAIDNDTKPVLIEKELTDTDYQKPKLTDNTDRFVEVLKQMVNGTGDFWDTNFSKAVKKAQEGDLMAAVDLSQTGGGMGSWYDSMYFDRELANRLYDERQHALLYSINYC